MQSAKHFIVKLFRFKQYLKVTDFEFKDRNKILNIQVKPNKNGCRCSACGRRCKIVGLAKESRSWRDPPIHGIEVYLVYHPREVLCPTHGRLQEEIPWAEAQSRITYRFEYTLLRFAQQMTQKAGAQLLKIPKSTFSNLLHRIVTREREGHRIRGLAVLGVDEIAYCRGHKYATIAYDLDRSKVIWIGAGKGSETLERFLMKHLSAYQRKQIEYACCDMSKAYTSVIKRCLKTATLIIDRFHVVKALNEAMDEVRKDEWRKVEKSKKPFFKGLRWLLFRHSSTRRKGQTKTIMKLKGGNNRIFRAWVLKDEFEHFWTYQYIGSAKKFLKSWTTRALKSRLEPMRKFVATLREHQEHILPFLETGITNAKGEGINRVLQMVKQRASGFANLDAFSDLIYLVIGDLDIPARIPERFRTI